VITCVMFKLSFERSKLNFIEDAAKHKYGVLMFVLFLVIYPIQHFLNPFFFKSHALFYDLVTEMIFCVIISFFSILLIWYRKINLFTQIVWVVLCITIGSLYLLLIPTVLERSLSIYMLSKLDPNSKVYSSNWEANIEINYFKDYKVFETRLIEQKVSGSIVEDVDGFISITDRGERIVRLTSFYRNLLVDKYEK